MLFKTNLRLKGIISKHWPHASADWQITCSAEARRCVFPCSAAETRRSELLREIEWQRPRNSFPPHAVRQSKHLEISTAAATRPILRPTIQTAYRNITITPPRMQPATGCWNVLRAACKNRQRRSLAASKLAWDLPETNWKCYSIFDLCAIIH